jgi:hypothetical protein
MVRGNAGGRLPLPGAILVPTTKEIPVKRVRKRLTYANVMSSIAVFLVLGGGAAFAATKLAKNSVGTKQLKNNAVTTKKIKNNAVTGAKVKESSLGQVPSAGNAETVGGNHIVKFSLNGASPIGNTQILDLNGLQIFASCTGGAVTATATTSVNSGEISTWADDASSETSSGEFDDDFNVGDVFTLATATTSDVLGDGAYTGGDLRTVRFFYNQEDGIGSNDCLFNGYAIG